MANHKSCKKRILVTAKKNAINTARRSAVKTAVKKATIAIESGNKENAVVATRAAESKLMKAAGKTISKKAASRKVSRLTKKIAKLA